MAENQTNGAIRHDAERNGHREKGNPDPGAATIQAWLVSKLSALLEIEANEIDVAEPFASYGLGSTELVSLSGELSEWLGRDLPAELAYEFPTIEALARGLADSSSPSQPATEASPVREANAEAIAIIGIGCRFPGAPDARAFWNLLRNGVDAIREVPADHFNLHDFYDPDPAAPGKIVTRWGGFIEHIDQFDAHFFGISPREAARMDPQQRLLLELAWDALEDAGQVRERLAGTPTGVFIGISNNDYGRIQFNDLDRIDAYAGTGNALSIAANRISYVFDFRGPSIALDTACSSSLVAIHQACNSLRSGESTLALAGGVNLILSPAITINFTKAGAMAPDGRCKAFDARANGYVRSEGAGVVVLKPLSRALADRDPIYAVIRGSAVNQDGRSNGLMAPNPIAQEAVLREAYRSAAVSPGDVQYVEAHGTGTLLGDPIEAKALGAVLALDRPLDRPCLVGSVKTNLGHLEAAAGIAGLIKVALALQHREIPPSLHFEQPNPHIPFDRLPLRVNTTLCPWPAPPDTALLAGVSSFGFGGTNAHVVVQGAPTLDSGVHATQTENGNRDAASTYLLPLSARSAPALQSLARSYHDFLIDPQLTAPAYDICYTAGARRSHHEYRLAATGNSAAQLADALETYSRGELSPGLSSSRKLSDRGRKLVFVFPGQGSQWLGMGRALLQHDAAFREAIERCDLVMRPHGDWSLLAELSATDAAHSRLNEVDVLQPALFAIQVALAALWRSWGIVPHAVVGHSMGEVAAAHVAGVLSLEDAARVICSRSRLVKPAIGRGAMAAVELSIADARRAIAGCEDRVSIAAGNGPTSTVLSGDPAALETIVSRLQRQDIFCRMLKVDFAAHSPQMEPLRADLERALQGLQPRPASMPIYSTVTGQLAGGLSFDPLYWSSNLREPVLFSAAVQQLLKDGHDIFLELSPHPILLSSIQQEYRHAGIEGAVIPSLRREEEEAKVLAGSLGALYTSGYQIEWSRIYPKLGRSVQLPSYPWDRERCWMDPPAGDIRIRSQYVSSDGAAKHSLLGRHFESAQTQTHFWESALDRSALSYLDDHRVEGLAILPAALYLEMALAAAAEAFPSQSFVLKDVEFRKALFIPDGATRTLQLILSPGAGAAASVHIYSCPRDAEQANRSWTLHATAKICPEPDPVISPVVECEAPAEIQARSSEQISGHDYYLKLRESGVAYGPSFQSIAQLWRGDREMLGEVKVPDRSHREFDACQFHPALLDACFQTLGAGVAAHATEDDDQRSYMPTHIDEIRVHGAPGLHLWSHAHLQEPGANSVKGDVRLLDETGHAAVEIIGLRFDSIGRDTKRAPDENIDDWLYEFQWQPRERSNERPASQPSAPAGPGNWLIFADSSGVGEKLGALIKAQGDGTVLVTRGESYERTDGGHFRINAERPEDMRQLLEAVLADDQPICRAVVHLWSLDAAPLDDATLTSLKTAQTLGCNSVLELVQELARVERIHLPRLWLITRGSQPAGEETLPLDTAQSPLWGLGRVVAQEHPIFWGGLMDLEPRPSVPDDAAHQLFKEISAPDGEDQLAFRQGRRYTGRLIRKPRCATQPAPLSWRADCSYLITGGLGELGLSVARRMVEQGARRLILMGRTKLPPRARWNSAEAGSLLAHRIAAIRELEALGASVHLAAVDVGDEGQLCGYIDEYRAEGWPPIRGVVHAAGVLQDGLLVQLDAAAMDSVLRPKMIGGWLLDQLLKDDPLDFFVLFSSAGSLLGQPGQGNYAAANAFLDALAHHRRALGKPALSVNWGAWSGLGFAETAGGKRLAARLAIAGIRSIAPAQALEVMERLLRQGSTQVAAVPVDWALYRQFFPAGTQSPLLSELAREDADNSPQAGHSSEKRIAILAAQPAERLQLIRSHLTELVARVLGLSASRLDVEQPLSNLGLDSLMAVELKNRIAVDLGVNVPMVTFLSGPSVEQAASQLLQLLTSETPGSSAPLASANGHLQGQQGNGGFDEHLLENLDQYSDEEVNSLLTDLLAKQEVSEK
ncbi:MAG TPA: beta-ketoacyl synthase N-terminal-like domain-containing protein [Terriglobales bacterium]|nr:beta-ketoacyl synthase N-terminal-like domain-containing protein [Terriglobales bacterium]